ncbi:tyrosine-protein phosphatase [Altererythrobacter sp. TH136]|uniref:tyrosine-protein phosphatase n=1 Tax=Altererythrobacter sp. TH136 TaxID=2067415 RepID=UPI001162632B|nr:tyrosine-protein phosphatase [Altererythrobacter sp. TH136]QDM40214.1 tyrosine-protein phosphatase [Altererythrobacter sp. TH136]
MTQAPNFQGIHNFRDYGGYSAAGGKVRRGVLYRSGQHVAATDGDLAELAALDIRTVIDLRGIAEREMHPCRRHEGWAGEVVAHDGSTTSSPPHMDIGPEVTTADYARDRMLQVYTRMPENPAMQAMFGRYLHALADRDGASLVHCFAGKDRTGMAVTLLLHIVGVSEDDQVREFLLTNESPTFHILRAQSIPVMEKRLGRTMDEASVRAMLDVHEDYFARFHLVARQTHGSLDDWLNQAVGVDDTLRMNLRDKFVA